MKRITHEEYMRWVENNRPEYEVIETYVNCSTKITHKHKLSGMVWKCSPEKFKTGVSHPQISRNNNSVIKRTHEEYVRWVENNRPEYEVIETYVNVKIKILHKHKPTQIQWKCSPEKFMKGSKPTELTKCERWNKNKYNKFLLENKIPIQLIGPFTRQSYPTLHLCLNTNVTFTIAPKHVISNRKFEYKILIDNTKKYKQWLLENYPEIIITEPYVSSHTKINHLHIETGACWVVKPNNVIHGKQRHPIEKPSSYSRRSIEWFNQIMREQNIEIQHQLNGGEYNIPSIGKVDGYCKQTNTVYEFHGDFWHGNPELFSTDDIHPVINKPFGSLYKQTKDRDKKIKKLGYNLIVKWESDFNQ